MAVRSVVTVLLTLLAGCQTIGSSQSALDAESRERLQARFNQLSADSAVATSDTDADRTIDQALTEAVELLHVGRDEDALTAFATVLRDEPNHVETIRLTAATARRIGDWRLQNAALKKLIELQDDSPAVLNQCGKALLQGASQHPSEAEMVETGLNALRRSVELAPDNPRFAQDLFAALAERGLDNEAEAVMAEAIISCPQDSLLRMAAARYFEAQDRWQDAIQQYNAALQISPRNLLWRRQRGICRARLQKWDDACDDLGPSLCEANAARLQTAFLVWADAAYQARRFDEVMMALDRLREEAGHRTPHTEQLRIRTLPKLRRPDEAIAVALQAMIDWPQDTELRQLAAELDGRTKQES